MGKCVKNLYAVLIYAIFFKLIGDIPLYLRSFWAETNFLVGLEFNIHSLGGTYLGSRHYSVDEWADRIEDRGGIVVDSPGKNNM